MLRIFIFSLIFFSNIAVSLSQITDAETENEIKTFITPLVKAAGLNINNIDIHLVVDPSINAFVIGGGDIFINTGLITRFAYDPNILYAVMAHEIAHLYAGHIIARRSEYEAMSKMAIGSVILGAAAAIAGAPDAGVAIGMAGTTAAQKNMLQHSRMHEIEADKIAVNLLYKTQNNGEGFMKLFRYLSRAERKYTFDPYSITHPLSMERMTSIDNAIKRRLHKFPNNITDKTRAKFKRIAIKIESYLGTPSEVIEKFYDNDYALSIGYFRLGKLNKAVKFLDKVIAKEPKDPYLLELKGQFYFENGEFELAKKYYQNALKYLSKDTIFKFELASTLIHQGKNEAELNKAILLLREIVIMQRTNVMAYYMLSRGYGKLGNKSKAILSLAEFYFYQGNLEKSKYLASKVIKITKKTSIDYLRASDIIEYVKSEKRE